MDEGNGALSKDVPDVPGASHAPDDDLARPSAMKALLGRHGIHPSRRFGQNFLTSRSALDRIVAAAALEPDETALEIGPGAGVLTRELSCRCRRVVALELDRNMIPVLADSLAGRTNVTIHQGDALRLDWNQVLEGAEPAKVVANIPYNITSPLLARILEHGPRFRSATLLVQREVADRMVARAGDDAYGSLSLFVAYHATARIVAKVPPGAFLPPPKVESAVVHLEPLRKPPVDEPADSFFRTTRAAFGQRRKTLRNALSAGLALGPESVAEILLSIGVDPGRRAETVDIATFAAIARGLRESLEGAARND